MDARSDYGADEPGGGMFLNEPPESRQAKALYESDQSDEGFVMNCTRLWAWRPDFAGAFADLRQLLTDETSLSTREREVLVCATVRALGDSYCALAWGGKLARSSNPDVAARLLRSGACWGLTKREKELAHWAELVTTNPNATSKADVDALRNAGFNEREIFEATAWVALRMAFCTINDALGAQPDAKLAARVPEAVRKVVGFGRAVASAAD